MRPLTFEFGGVVLPVFAALDLSMTYEQIGGFTLLRSANGTGIKQQAWRKNRVSISGIGQIPLGLEILDYSTTHILKCSSPMAMQVATTGLTLPNYWRRDVDLEAYALIDIAEELVETDVSLSVPHGYQVVNVGGAITGGSATGLANDATVYTANVTVDGVLILVTVTGSAAQTYTTLLSAINADLGASATAAIVGGNVRITSASFGGGSTVLIVDTLPNKLFFSLTDYVAILAAVDGTNAVTITSVTGAIAYRVNFWPQFTVFADPPSLDNNRRDSSIGWNLVCEEV